MPYSAKQKMQRIARERGVILLYHSVMEQKPEALVRTLHNVTASQLTNHLTDLSDYFEFVSLSEFSAARSKAGLACVTFDDGYRNVLENALPIMESLDYPFTLFLNPVTFKHRWNWRDKVRHVIHHEQVDAFLKTYDMAFTEGRFYRYSKNPANNSAALDAALDRFLANQTIDIYGFFPYLTEAMLDNNSLVSYGNHSFNHYVLSSLSEQQQMREIRLAHQTIRNLGNLTICRCFCAPFGGPRDINPATIDIVDGLSYNSLLLSRQRLQPKQSLVEKVQILERVMPRNDDIIRELVTLADKE